MLTREQLDDLVVDYMYDELTAQDREAVEAALLQHPDLADEVAAHRETRSLMAKMPMLDPPQPMLDTVMRAARHAAAPAEPKVGVWQRVLGMFAQPAFATFAVVAGIAMTAVFALSDSEDSTRSAQNAPMVAQVNRVEGPSAPARDEVAPKAPESEIAALDDDGVEEVGTSVDKLAAADLKAEPTEAPSAKQGPTVAKAEASKVAPKPAVVAARSVRAKPRKKLQKAAPVAPAPIVVADGPSSADDGRADIARKASAAQPAAESIRVAEASAPTTATLNSKPSAPPSATTHPKINDTSKTPANAGPRLTKRFEALVKAGKLEEAAKVLAQLEKIPTMSKSKVAALKKTLTKASKPASKKAAPKK